MRKGQTLVGLLAVIAIMAILGATLFYGSGVLRGETRSARPDGKGKTVPGLVKLKAEDEVCRSNLNSLRQSIGIAMSSNEDQPPASLEETRLGTSFYSCPLGKEPYNYDPQTGQVSCPHPGHEKY